MDKYTTPPYIPENGPTEGYDPGIFDQNDLGGEKAAQDRFLNRKRIKTKDAAFAMEKRVHGGTRNHQKNGWIKGR